jgi:hypothetical protein
MRGFADEEQDVLLIALLKAWTRVDSMERRLLRPSTPSNHQCADFSK